VDYATLIDAYRAITRDLGKADRSAAFADTALLAIRANRLPRGHLRMPGERFG
jgi:hypothetical protein